MGFLFIVPLAVLAGWSIFAIQRWLKRGNYGPKWWRSFTLLACAGAVLGLWFALFQEYNVANKRIHGFPIPTQISERDKPANTGVGASMPIYIRIGGTVTDFLCGVAICLAPIAVAAFFKENRGKLEPGAGEKPSSNGPA
jgi:hypothetical protein